MTGTTESARIWSTLDVYRAPLGTDAPTDVTTAWEDVDAGWIKLGYLDEDNGLEEAAARSITDHFAYGGYLLRTGVKAQKHTMKFWALEDNATVHALHNPGGAATATTTGGVSTVDLKEWEPNPGAFGFELSDGEIIKRIIVPRGDCPDAPDSKKTTDDGIEMIGLTVTCYSVAKIWGTLITNNTALDFS